MKNKKNKEETRKINYVMLIYKISKSAVKKIIKFIDYSTRHIVNCSLLP